MDRVSGDTFSFDSTYLDYYQDRLEKAADGTSVPGPGVIAKLIEKLEISRCERVLDVGCSFGRLLPLLRPLSEEVFGLELSYDVVNVAAQREYRCVVRGRAEDTNLPSSYFSHLVLFGVFDCCDQAAALREIRRLMTPNGRALITGKNVNYRGDDYLALIAERNAWRKRFPNSFTRASRLAELLPKFGLELQEMLRFERRGDFGEMRLLQDDSDSYSPFYEYAIIVAASGQAAIDVQPADLEVSAPVSDTAKTVAGSQSLSVETLFQSDILERMFMSNVTGPDIRERQVGK